MITLMQLDLFDFFHHRWFVHVCSMDALRLSSADPWHRKRGLCVAVGLGARLVETPNAAAAQTNGRAVHKDLRPYST